MVKDTGPRHFLIYKFMVKMLTTKFMAKVIGKKQCLVKILGGKIIVFFSSVCWITRLQQLLGQKTRKITFKPISNPQQDIARFVRVRVPVEIDCKSTKPK